MSPDPALALAVIALLLSIISIAVSFWSASFSRRAKNAELRCSVLARASGLILQIQEAQRQYAEVRIIAEEFNSVALYKKADMDKVSAVLEAANNIYARLSNLPVDRGLEVYESLFHDIEQTERRITIVTDDMRAALEKFHQ